MTDHVWEGMVRRYGDKMMDELDKKIMDGAHHVHTVEAEVICGCVVDELEDGYVGDVRIRQIRVMCLNCGAERTYQHYVFHVGNQTWCSECGATMRDDLLKDPEEYRG